MENENEESEDKILIKGLLLRCVIGVNEWERKEKQDIVINIVLWSDLIKAAETNDIRRTVNYKEITKAIIKLVEKSQLYLIEALAEKVAEVCLQNEKVSKVKVTVEKPGALRFAKSVGVEIIRKRTGP